MPFVYMTISMKGYEDSWPLAPQCSQITVMGRLEVVIVMGLLQL